MDTQTGWKQAAAGAAFLTAAGGVVLAAAHPLGLAAIVGGALADPDIKNLIQNVGGSLPAAGISAFCKPRAFRAARERAKSLMSECNGSKSLRLQFRDEPMSAMCHLMFDDG